RASRTISQDDRHLQQHPEGVANVVRTKFGETLGAVAALKEEGLPLGDRTQHRPKLPRLAGEYQRRIGAQRRLHRGECATVGVFGNLPYRQVPPALWRPVPAHLTIL